MKITVGTRGSLLARTQTEWLMARLRESHPGLATETRIIVTGGDRIAETPLAAVGGKGLFVREIEDALLAGEIDVAVHSLKDLPGEQPAGLVLGAIPVREDPTDAWISRSGEGLDELRPGATVGTTSLRRAAQVLARRPDVRVVPYRGNIDTRLRKLSDGVVDATLLAVAGLSRAGLAGRITQRLPRSVMVPAAGQGALAVEIRADDARTAGLLAPLADAQAAREVTAERRVIARLAGDCNAPIGVNAESSADGRTLTLRAVVLSADGRRAIRAERVGAAAEPASLADAVFTDLRDGGAMELLAEAPKPGF